MADNIRYFDGIPYKRVTEVLTRAQAIAKAKQIRERKFPGKVYARVDTYKSGFAVWERVPESLKRKRQSKSTWYRDERQMPEGYNPLAEGEVLSGTYRLKQKRLKRIKTLKIVAKKKVKFPLNNKTKLFEKLDQDNKRAGVWSMRMEILVASGKWRAGGKAYHYDVALHYFNDYFEYEELENSKRAAVKNGAFHVLLNVKIEGNWYGSHSNVVNYREAKKDFAYAVNLIKEAYDMSQSEDRRAIYDNFYDSLRAADWEKFG